MTIAFILALVAALGLATCFFFALNYIRRLEKELSWTREEWHKAVKEKENDKQRKAD